MRVLSVVCYMLWFVYAEMKYVKCCGGVIVCVAFMCVWVYVCVAFGVGVIFTLTFCVLLTPFAFDSPVASLHFFIEISRASVRCQSVPTLDCAVGSYPSYSSTRYAAGSGVVVLPYQ